MLTLIALSAALTLSGGDWALPRCDRNDERCQVLRRKVGRLNARDPEAEASDAVGRGDFRLGGYNHIGPMPQGWELPGVVCTRWSMDMVGKWHVNQDVVFPGDDAHTAASVGFIARYNRAMVTDPAFAYRDLCAPEGGRPATGHRGEVKTWAEAARTGDPGRLTGLSGQDVDARDPFGMSALDWATLRRDEPMARALLEAGADPNVHADEGPTPLARALRDDRFDLARLMLDKGARMEGLTGLCDRLDGPPPGERNNSCSWAGLLAAKGQFDLLDEVASRMPLDRPVLREIDILERPQPTVVALDSQGELTSAFLERIAAGDETAAARLLPLIGRGFTAPFTLPQLDALRRPDLLRAYVLAHGADAARSPAEADLWRAAAEAGQDEALAFLRDYGAELNLLSAEALARCRIAARAGDVAALLVCVEEAGQRRETIHAAVMANDHAVYLRLVGEASDVRERHRSGLLAFVAKHGDATMLSALTARGARFEGTTPKPTAVYAGALKSQADALAARPGHESLWQGGDSEPVMQAALRGDRESVRVLVDAGAGGLLATIQRLGNLGNPPAGMTPLYLPGQDVDSEVFPNNDGSGRLEALDIVAEEAARVYGPQSLERPFQSAAYSGYNDVLERLLAHGLDLRQAKRPGEIWFAWAGLGQPCKPSTGRILLRAGLPVTYPASEFTTDPALHVVASRCMNPRSIAVMVSEGGVDVNMRNAEGDTAVDRTILYNEPALQAALRALGGRSAEQLDPAAVGQRRAETRSSSDLDLVQNAAE